MQKKMDLKCYRCEHLNPVSVSINFAIDMQKTEWQQYQTKTIENKILLNRSKKIKDLH